MMLLSEAARALGVLYPGTDMEFTGVSTDSRVLRAGELFVALKGERFDAHAFIAEAAAAGAAAALINKTALTRSAQMVPKFSFIAVDDTLQALAALALYWRRKFDIPLVALTGSNGKTTVKEMLAGILREAVSFSSSATDRGSPVLATQGNLNNHIGVPLTLLALRRNHRYAVVEMGMNHAGELRSITRLAEPDVALITNAGFAHMENLGSTEAIARAKGEIFEGLKADGVAVINADDCYAPLWRDMTRGLRRIEFALETAAPVTATYRLREIDSDIVLRTPLGSARATVPVPGMHNVKNAVAAGAAATALEVPPATVAAGLARFHGVHGRLERKAGARGATLIDDTYNANPDSVRAGIAVLAHASAIKILALGDMGELGQQAPALHEKIGEFARASGVHHLFTLGDLSAHAARAFGAGARHFESMEDLTAAVETMLAPNVTVLVKGSRFMRMERLVAALEAKAPGSSCC